MEKKHGGSGRNQGRKNMWRGQEIAWKEGISLRDTPEKFRRVGYALVEDVGRLNALAKILSQHPELRAKIDAIMESHEQ